MIKKIVMKNLTCASCINKIERRVSRLNYVNSASFNYANQILIVDFKDEYNESKALKEIKDIVDALEDNILTYYYENKPIEHKTSFFKEYFFVLLGVFIFALNFGIYRIPQLFDQSVVPYFLTQIFYWLGYLLLISRLIIKQIKNFRKSSFFDENTLMIIATLAAMIIGKHEEAIGVIMLYSIGEHLQNRAVQKSKNEISSLMNIKIEFANILVNEKIIIKDPLQIKIGDVLVIKNGERIAVDGEVILGSTSLNTSQLTGESKLQRVDVGSNVLSGTINVGEVIHVRADKEYNSSTLAKLIDLIENSTSNKSSVELFITKFSKIYTPIVVGLALLLVLVGWIIAPNEVLGLNGYLYRAAIFLVISCPCSLVLSIPLSYYAGIGAAAKRGILFKGSTFIQTLTDVKTIAMDKTGTLTHGSFFVTEYTDDETLKVAASIEKFSSHPIAAAIVTKFGKRRAYETENTKEIPGYGISATINGKPALAGSQKFIESFDIKINQEKMPVGSYTFIALDNKYLGYVVVKDELKESSMETVRYFTKHYDTVMLTGDNEASASEIAQKLGGIEYYAGLLPEQKLEKFNAIRTNSVSLYVGDGINDAPLLKNADIGVSMGSASDLAIEVSDIIIINNDIRFLDMAIRIAKKTRLIATENIVFSMAVKLIFLVLSVFGVMYMWFSIFADVGVTLLCVLNALRIIYQQKNYYHDFKTDNQKKEDSPKKSR
ncbi:MAG: heavy metal translocating P-type ATPase [Candidatus Izemoplasmatales bacterium]|nr:heavy metal translocating P-type ATPase [Candidatus Izemoplasmatales bacterium]